MTEPRACPECLRRSWLLGSAAPYIEEAMAGEGAPGIARLLGLDNYDLATAVAPSMAASLVGQAEALAENYFSAQLHTARCWATCRHDERYPAPLREAGAAPWALIGRGDPSRLESIAWSDSVSVVGSRRATSYGREVSRALGRDIAHAGRTVISGMDYGIDTCAHRGAIEGGSTVAVFGCGPDVAYPASHRSLWRRICETGLVLSELPPGAVARRWTFPARNRIIAGISGMTVVVEAARRSGSLQAANFAADFGREVGAVPGPVTGRASLGTNDLLAGGARVVRDASDVLDASPGEDLS